MLSVTVVLNFRCVCLYVCLSNDNSRKPRGRKFIFAHVAHLEGIRVRFVYEAHWVKVRVAGAEEVQNSYPDNVKLRSAITLVI